MPKVEESIEFRASAKKCYDVIWDYAKYPDFVTGVNEIEVKKKKDKNHIDVVFHVSIIKDIEYTVAVIGTPYERVDWTLTEGSAFKKIIGRWDLEEIKKNVTLATYSLDLEFGMYVPGPIAKSLISASLPSMLKSFKDRIENKK